ncbi:hypothetical protein AM1_5641 [Acaryochloris marina MBIC11017]|uniref:Uncharacterized protein n=1 Tax=Acaryochloris marina (strain MBIC 11017) TaxID=329726 RepID=B0CF75_ACAM1|nr:hypothetical protein AM1_5641 [Acaryochloris marina MBIC11017]
MTWMGQNYNPENHWTQTYLSADHPWAADIVLPKRGKAISTGTRAIDLARNDS